MNYTKAIEGLYAHLENDAVESAVMACVRIARAAKDYVNAAVFLRELYPEKSEVARVLMDDMSSLKPDAQKFVWEFSLNRWLELHTLEFNLDEDQDEADGDRKKVLKIAAGEIQSDLDQCERAIADLVIPPGMTPFDAAAFTDSFHNTRARYRMRIRAVQTIKSRLKTRCLNYAIQIERQLDLQQQSQGFLEGVQNEVNNHFKARSEDLYNKLRKATQLALSDDVEDASLLLTEVRRALKAAADFFYPPLSEKVMCADGLERSMGEEQYLNRLQEYLRGLTLGSTAKELLRAEFDHLTSFLRRLNEIASKGVHTATTLGEARQGLVSLYFFLFNLCQHLTTLETGAGGETPAAISNPTT